MSTRYIPSGVKITCIKCGITHMLTEDIDSEMLPINLACPTTGCGYIERWTNRIPPIAKCAAPSDTFWELDQPERFDEHEVSDGIDSNPTVDEEIDKLVEDTFQNKAERIARYIINSSELMSEMKESLSILTQLLADEFSDAWVNADNFHNHWKPGYISEFLLAPYLPIPIDVENPNAKPFTRYIASPKFFDFARGIPLSCTGGYYSYLINAYTEASIDTHRSFLSMLGIPKFNIQLNEKHITGPDLRNFDEVPGTEHNVDHTDDFHSLYIVNSLAARTWLVRHGIRPWNPVPFRKLDIAPSSHGYGIAMSNADLASALNSMIKYGRILFCNIEEEVLRKAVRFFVDAFPKERFLKITADESSIFGRHRNMAALHVNSQQLRSMEIFKMFGNVIINLDEGIPSRILEMLYRYRGRVILYSHDAIMDSLESCEMADLVYGLVAHTHFFFPYSWRGGEDVNRRLPWMQRFSPQFTMTIEKIKELGSRKYVMTKKKPQDQGDSQL